MAVNASGHRVTIDGPDGIILESDDEHLSAKPPTDDGAIVSRLIPSLGIDQIEGRRRFEVIVDGWLIKASIEPSRAAALRERSRRAASQAGHHIPIVIRAQIPGRVVRVWVAQGEAVEAGQRLVAVEAMKMENELKAPRAGTVDSLRAAMGQTVETGDELVTIA